jgi:hypothetical protein
LHLTKFVEGDKFEPFKTPRKLYFHIWNEELHN